MMLARFLNEISLAAAPHYLVIDMGTKVEIAGFRYTPRQVGTNGRIRLWRFYAGDSLVK